MSANRSLPYSKTPCTSSEETSGAVTGSATRSVCQTIESQQATIRSLRRKLIGLALGLLATAGFVLLGNPGILNTLVRPAEAQFEFQSGINGQADAPVYSNERNYPQHYAAADSGNGWADWQTQASQAPVYSAEQPSASRTEQRTRIYRQRMEQLRERFLQTPEPDVNTAIAINLYDMNRALATLPIMAQQLQAMNQKLQAVPDIAEQMHDISNNIGVMTSGVDSTLGRMGSRMGRYGMGWPPY